MLFTLSRELAVITLSSSAQDAGLLRGAVLRISAADNEGQTLENMSSTCVLTYLANNVDPKAVVLSELIPGSSSTDVINVLAGTPLDACTTVSA